ncbi:MAG: hypothetical protein LBP40_04585 [Campylobacteraceae bacterium]|jgi:hypothetical protein|nr:hypothetical protein [Campylobacteraceae bacterium]
MEKAINDFTITVGANGDYPSLQSALNYVSALQHTNGVTGTIQLLSGYSLSGTTTIKNVDLSWCQITGQDAVTTGTTSGSWQYIFVINNAKTPIFNQSITINGGVNSVMFTLENGSTIFFGASKSFIHNGNLSFIIFAAANSSVVGSSNTFQAGTGPLYTTSAYINLPNSTFVSTQPYGGSGAPYSPIRITGGTAYIPNPTIDSADYPIKLDVLGGAIVTANNMPDSPSQTANILTANGIIFDSNKP